ncbi:MAG: sugar phosphate nucleotidyltransferase, partial [Bacillota bacterium]
SNQSSMGIYVFNTDALIKALGEVDEENLDFGKHIIPHMIGGEVYAYVFKGYWKDVGTYDSYLEASLELTNTVDKVPLDMYERDWRIYTKSEELPSVKIGSKAEISQALISNGSIIAGHVTRSVISPGVIIHPNATVKNSVILNDTEIMPGAVVENSIIDKNVLIDHNVTIGTGEDYTANKERPDLLSSGINVVAKGVRIPEDTVIPRNCRIHSTATFKQKRLESGETLK